jgi:hypothetical protein
MNIVDVVVELYVRNVQPVLWTHVGFHQRTAVFDAFLSENTKTETPKIWVEVKQ